MSISYQSIVEKEAYDFITDNWNDFILEALMEGNDFDRNDIDGLDDAWHSQITDKAYNLTDAAFIIENSGNVETDRGLWEGQEPSDALSAQAAYTFSNDVWEKAQEMYEEIQEAIAPALDDLDIVLDTDGEELGEDRTRYQVLTYESDEINVIADREDDGFLGVEIMSDGKTYFVTEENKDSILPNLKVTSPVLAAAVTFVLKEATHDLDEDDLKKAISEVLLEDAYRTFENTYGPDSSEIEPGSDLEKRKLRRYLELSRSTGSMRAGYPLGSAYIDARCGTGYGNGDEYELVELNRELGRRCPHLAGKYGQDLRTYYEETYSAPKDEKDAALSKVLELINDNASLADFHALKGEIETALNKKPGMRL